MSEKALLVVDVQVAVMEESVNSDDVIANVQSLVRKAREVGVPVVWVRHQADVLEAGSDGWQLVPQLVPESGEPIVEKRWADSFVETDLEAVLSERGIRELVLCGAQSDACIRSTFYGGIYRGYSVTLVTDAHTTGDYREWGVDYSPEDVRTVLNGVAASTRQPGATGAVTTTAEAFA